MTRTPGLSLVAPLMWGLLGLSACLDSTSGTSGTVQPADALDTAEAISSDASPTDASPTDAVAVDAVADMADAIGPPACCSTDTDCGGDPGVRCFEGLCLGQPPAGRCWDTKECASGQSCLGTGVCSCGAVCEQWFDGPGYCVDPGQTCLALDESHFGGCDAELGVIFDGSACVIASGCDCYGFCDFVYDTVEACEVACGLAPSCLIQMEIFRRGYCGSR